MPAQLCGVGMGLLGTKAGQEEGLLEGRMTPSKDKLAAGKNRASGRKGGELWEQGRVSGLLKPRSGHRSVEGAAQPSALSSSGQIPTL